MDNADIMNMVHHNFAPDDPYGAIAEQAHGRIMPQAAREWFFQSGVKPIDLVKTWSGYSDLILHDDVVFLDGGRFEYLRHFEGEAADTAALTFLCWSHDGIAEDICAWQATTGRLATWLGHACMLGEDNLLGPRPDAGLFVHRDPLQWIKAGRSGVVILDAKRAGAKLRELGTLAVASVDEGKRLKKALSVDLPEILVAQGGAA